jgi:hypothetical protein
MYVIWKFLPCFPMIAIHCCQGLTHLLIVLKMKVEDRTTQHWHTGTCHFWIVKPTLGHEVTPASFLWETRPWEKPKCPCESWATHCDSSHTVSLTWKCRSNKHLFPCLFQPYSKSLSSSFWWWKVMCWAKGSKVHNMRLETEEQESVPRPRRHDRCMGIPLLGHKPKRSKTLKNPKCSTEEGPYGVSHTRSHLAGPKLWAFYPLIE